MPDKKVRYLAGIGFLWQGAPVLAGIHSHKERFMRIAHVSDFHVFVAGEAPPLVRPDIVPAVRSIVADVAAFSPALDACMLTGDLAGTGTPEEYALLRELLSPLPMPWFAIPGNHDAREPFRMAFKDLFPFEDEEFLHYEAEFQGIRILALDTVDPGSNGGGLCQKRLAWFKRKVETPFDGLTLILMHHQPYWTGINYHDSIGLNFGKEHFGALVASLRGRARILCGHIHRPSTSLWNGAFAAIGGSPAFTIDLYLQPDRADPPLVDNPYAYFVHTLNRRTGEFAVSPRYMCL